MFIHRGLIVLSVCFLVLPLQLAAQEIEIPKITFANNTYLKGFYWSQFVRKGKDWKSGSAEKLFKANSDMSLTVTAPPDKVDQFWIAFGLGPKKDEDFGIVMYVKDFPKGQRLALLKTEGEWQPLAEVEVPAGTAKIELARKSGVVTCNINNKPATLKVLDESVTKAKFDPGFSFAPGESATIAGLTRDKK